MELAFLVMFTAAASASTFTIFTCLAHCHGAAMAQHIAPSAHRMPRLSKSASSTVVFARIKDASERLCRRGHSRGHLCTCRLVNPQEECRSEIAEYYPIQ